MTEAWAVRPAARLFSAQEKAELEQLLREEAEANLQEIPFSAGRPPSGCTR
jgi:hypothetical protein